MSFNFPDHFVRTQIDLQGVAGHDWLAGLPAVVEHCAYRWQLTIERMMEPLTYNFLVSAHTAEGRPVVVKICPPNGEFASQRAALEHFAGHGAVQLLDDDRLNDALLLERCIPGGSLRQLPDVTATEITGTLMRTLWKPIRPESDFPTLSDWGNGFARMRRHFGSTGPFPTALVERAENSFAAFDPTSVAAVLLHGDLHHDNILGAQREPWLAIDPKGVIGDPAYEPATFIINQTKELIAASDRRSVLRRRIDGLAVAAELDRSDVRAWAIAHAILSAWWTFEDHGQIGEFALFCAEEMART